MTSNVLWALLILSTVGALLCARTRAAGPALFFGVFAVLLFVATPIGEEVRTTVIELFHNDTPSAATSSNT